MRQKDMKSTICTSILAIAAMALIPIASQGQTLKKRMAEQYFEVFDYPKAAAIYEDLVASGKATDTDMRALALAYKRMQEWDKAEKTYARMMGTGTARPIDMLEYAEVLRNNGKYEDALTWYENYADQNPDDGKASTYLKQKGLFDRLLKDSTGSVVRKLPINSDKADIGVTVMEELLLFSSARGEGAGGRTAYNWDGEPYLNVYSALLKGETAEDPLVMRKDVNSRFHDGIPSFDSIAHRMYYTRNNFHYGVMDKAANGELKLGIFYLDVVEGPFGNKEWGPLMPFDHNDAQYNTGQPCVAPNGRKLFFVSDRPGGLGGTDIWVCDDLGNQWGAPYNIGAPINTPGNEMYPFIAQDSTLFFASNGHPGLGGYDIFRARLRPAGPGRVFNLGHPLNTRHNEHGLILLADDSTGFFSSDRPGGMGSDDIYGCTVRPQMLRIEGIVRDKDSKEPIEGATILVKNEKGQHIDRFTLTSLPGGKFELDVAYEEVYHLMASKNGYSQSEVTVNTDTDALDNIVLELVKYDYAVQGLITHAETEGPLDGVTVRLLDGAGAELETTTTDDQGRYAFGLKPESDYRVVVEKEKFFKQSKRISTKGRPNSVIYADFSLIPLAVDQVVRLDNIFYDYNKANIRPDAAIELDKLVLTLNDNPTVAIELSSHTDCRGSDSYNLSLSERRAKSAVDYIISKGIDKSRVTSKGYGESKPSETCACEKCTEEEHQRNRRTEFKVLKL